MVDMVGNGADGEAPRQGLQGWRSRLRLPWLLITLALVTSFWLRLVNLLRYNTFDIGPDPDQVRDAFVAMAMAAGDWPTLGPASSIGGYQLPPLYYYLAYPATWLGPDPRWQVLPNSLLTFLATPLLIYAVYRLLSRTPLPQRLWVAGLVGLWQSLVFSEIFIGTFQWNPSSLSFWLYAFVLAAHDQLTAPFHRRRQIIAGAIWGVSLAILVSLHSATLFVMPVVTVVLVAALGWKYRHRLQRAALGLTGVGVAVVTLAPYWLGEWSRGFGNTRQILRAVLRREESSSLLVRLQTMVMAVVDFGHQVYFFKGGALANGLFVVVLLVALGLTGRYFRGDRTLLGLLALPWFIFLYAASNFSGDEFPFHYKLIILYAPIIFIALALGSLPAKPRALRTSGAAVLLAAIALSIALNLNANVTYWQSRWGPNRLVNTEDLRYALTQIPSGSTLCDPLTVRRREVYNQYAYLAQYVTNQVLTVTAQCQAGDYWIQPQRKMTFEPSYGPFPAFGIVDATLPDVALSPLGGNTVVALYQLEADFDTTTRPWQEWR